MVYTRSYDVALDTDLNQFNKICIEQGPFFKTLFVEGVSYGDRFNLKEDELKQTPNVSHVSRDYWKKKIPYSDPPTDGGGLTISGNLKSFEGPVLKCRVSTEHRTLNLNELVIHEIRNNASAIFQNFLFSCWKIEFVQLW